MESRNRPTEDERLSGTEGSVWCVVEPSERVALWKCKPESVEQINWTAGINKKAVTATCRNCLETSDDLTYEALEPLLLEEYNEESIRKFRPAIDEFIRVVRHEFEFKEAVLTAYERVGV